MHTVSWTVKLLSLLDIKLGNRCTNIFAHLHYTSFKWTHGVQIVSRQIKKDSG